MNELISKVEARLADRREELESWGTTSRAVTDVIESEIKFLEALLAEMKAMAAASA